MKKLIGLTILTYFLGGCAREVGSYSFENTDSVKIDESKLVLTNFPSGMEEINDSVVGIVNMGQKISLYNINTGNNIRNFSTENINFDSIINVTFQKRYPDKREYIYDAIYAGGLSDGNSQVKAFRFSDNAFYIYVNTLVEVKLLNDPDQLKKYENNPEVKAALKLAGSANLSVMEYIEFIFVTDNLFRLKKVIPQYEKAKLKREDYSPFYQKGFTINEGSVYVPILKGGQTFENVRSKLKDDKAYFSLAKFDLANPDSAVFRLSFKDMDFTTLSLQDYLSSYFQFKNDAEGLLFSNGKEICDVETGEKLFAKKSLKSNEWISDFHKNNDNEVTMVTYKLNKKLHPTETEVAYGIDSVSGIQIKVFNENTGWSPAKQIPSTVKPMFLVTKNKIIYIEKDKDNYYFKHISYHEN